MVLHRTSPFAGVGMSVSIKLKSDPFGSPFGRAARRTCRFRSAFIEFISFPNLLPFCASGYVVRRLGKSIQFFVCFSTFLDRQLPLKRVLIAMVSVECINFSDTNKAKKTILRSFRNYS